MSVHDIIVALLYETLSTFVEIVRGKYVSTLPTVSVKFFKLLTFKLLSIPLCFWEIFSKCGPESVSVSLSTFSILASVIEQVLSVLLAFFLSNRFEPVSSWYAAVRSFLGILVGRLSGERWPFVVVFIRSSVEVSLMELRNNRWLII